jgi:hypothetical protein
MKQNQQNDEELLRFRTEAAALLDSASGSDQR